MARRNAKFGNRFTDTSHIGAARASRSDTADERTVFEPVRLRVRKNRGSRGFVFPLRKSPENAVRKRLTDRRIDIGPK